MLPATTTRVPEQTAEHINERIRHETKQRVARCAAQGREAIDRRLRELDHEWDTERTLEANASTIALIGLGLGTFVDRRFYALPAAVAGFLLQHALQGWCPPLPIFRRYGFRNAAEIAHERHALKALRGDFEGLSSNGASANQAAEALRAAER